MVKATGWKNKKGTGNRTCKCGSWKQHWINYSGKKWPDECSVKGCENTATLGAHIYNENERDEYIVPMCESCNKKAGAFDLDRGVTLVPANTSKTCDR